MKALLHDEVERGIHGANAKLKDERGDGAAVGAARPRLLGGALRGCPTRSSGARSRRRCSGRTSRPSRRSTAGSRAAALYCAGSAPDWVALSPSLAPSAAALHDDLRLWVRVLRLLNDRMRAIHEELGLEDERKTI